MKKILIVVALIIAIGFVLYAKKNVTKSKTEVIKSEKVDYNLPKLLDLGSGKCTSCKMMKPILAEIRTENVGKFTVEFLDVFENKEAAEKYRIQSIPTQIFFDADAKELYRHTGFISKEDILKKWKELIWQDPGTPSSSSE